MLRDLIFSSSSTRTQSSIERSHAHSRARKGAHTYIRLGVCVCVVFVCVHVCQAIFERGSFSHSIFIISLHLSLFVSVVSLSPSWCEWGAVSERKAGVSVVVVLGGHFSKTTVEGSHSPIVVSPEMSAESL